MIFGNDLTISQKHSWVRCALQRAPHPNYTGSLLNFARVLDYAQAGPRKVEATFASDLSLRVVRVLDSNYSDLALRSLKLLSPSDDHTVDASGSCSLHPNRAP